MFTNFSSVDIRNLSKKLLHDPQSLHDILDSARIPINYCSTDLRFIFVNKAYADWYGKLPEEIIGMKLEDLLGGEGNETIRPYYERVLKGEYVEYETGVNLSIGYRYMQCNYTPMLDETGEVIGWVGMIYDMTERHLLEKALHEKEEALILAKEKAEAANKAKSEFLANMSHEIRTPLNAVVGLSNILNMTKPLTERQIELVDTLQISAQSLLTLINDLLDFSKIESNRIELERVPFRFSTVIEEVMAIFSIQANQKRISLNYEGSSFDKTFFLGDPLRLRQVLTNLVGNAVKFTKEGGITLALRASPHPQTNCLQVELSVKDTGIGISSDKLKAVFDKFTQADMSITRQFGGSGLGLSISKSLIELMGGTITLDSELGKGSQFFINLPMEYASQASMGGSGSQKSAVGSSYAKPDQIRVLLAEDHYPNILVATTLLEDMGYAFDVVRTGKEVLEKLEEDPNGYHIILMDIQMPELDGYATTHVLREKELMKGAPRIPIIGVTAHVMEENINKCFECGMDDYIAKPFEFDALKQKISVLTRSKPPNDQALKSSM